jgi:hypothetical protein
MANQYFNAAYYLAQNPDVAAAGYTLATAEQHYVKFGAAEGRNPNTYFNATQYLAQYPDLVVAGITKATALQHYAQFGLNEGRLPSLAAIPADFSYSSYAAANADLRTAFGITDTANLTAAQQHSLLAHYLSYGYVEGRPGVVAVNGDSFFTTIGSNTITLNAPTTLSYTGTSGNDNFIAATGVAADGTIINGLGGSDTLTISNLAASAGVTLNSVENLVVTETASSTLTVSGGASNLSAITVNHAATAFTYAGAKVDSFVLNGTAGGSVVANFTPASVTGTSDALKVTLGAASVDALTVNGIETFNVVEGTGTTGLALHANGVNGAALAVTLTGGAAGAASTIALDTAGSGQLTSVTVDGSAALSNQTITVAGNGQPLNVNVTVTGGAGSDNLTGSTTSDIAHTNTLNGGAGIDTLHTSAAIDVLAGGAGNDIIQITNGSSFVRTVTTGGVTTIAATDSVTDFQAGDTLAFAAATLQGTSVNMTTNVGTVANGVITFNNGVEAGGLQAIIALLDTNMTADSSALFKVGSDTYFVHVAAAAPTLANTDIIKLTGVDLTKVAFDVAGTHVTMTA